MESYASSTAAQNHPVNVTSVIARTNNISNVILINIRRRLLPNQSKHTIHLVKTNRHLNAGTNYLLVGSSFLPLIQTRGRTYNVSPPTFPLRFDRGGY